VRGVGEGSDIVGKEMYSFTDKGGRHLTLRPENTAAVARAYVEHGMQSWPHPVRLFYVGPQFRYERPQKGRSRQFHQIGAELIGDASAFADVELILMLHAFLSRLGFSGLQVLINTVGDAESRRRYAERLVEYLAPRKDQLSEDNRRRLEANPLRILDSKSPEERTLLLHAPVLQDFLTDESKGHFDEVLGQLSSFSVPHQVSSSLVRGLDYYTHTVFEIVSQGLGAQNAIVGGGRYDGLIAELGGPPRSAIGFAIGEDRLIEVLPESFRQSLPKLAPVAIGVIAKPATGEQLRQALALAEELRQAGIAAVVDFQGRSPGSFIKWAERQGATRVVFLGEEELARGEATLKDLETGDQRRLQREELASALAPRSPAIPP
jgi:histidyl-tRNA synthetase